jgi:hypothetical protein
MTTNSPVFVIHLKINSGEWHSFHLREEILVGPWNEDMRVGFDVEHILFLDWYLTLYWYIVILSLFCYFIFLLPGIYELLDKK